MISATTLDLRPAHTGSARGSISFDESWLMIVVLPMYAASVRQYPEPASGRGVPTRGDSVDPERGKYIAEMSDAEQAEFWQRVIGEPLSRFVDTYL